MIDSNDKPTKRISPLEHLYHSVIASPIRLGLCTLALCVLPFFFATFAWDPNGMNDDWALAMGLSTLYEPSRGYALFLSPVLSEVIYRLNMTFPTWNWFFVLEQGCSFLAYFTAVYIAFRRSPALLASLFYSALTIIILPECTTFSNFTVTAGICCIAALAALFAGIWEAKGRTAILYAACATVFFLFGAFWRWNAFLLCMPATGIGLAFWLLRNTRLQLWDRAKRILAFTAPALVLCSAVFVVGQIQLASEPLLSWTGYCDANSYLVDFPQRPYEEISEELTEIGVSENDYNLITGWISGDPEFFTVELMTQIAEISRIQQPILETISSGAFAYEFFFGEYERALYVAILLLIALALRRDKSMLLTAFVLFATTLLMCFYLKGAGRLPLRVHDPLWFFAFTTLLFGDTREGSPQVPSARLKRFASLCYQTFAVALPVLSLFLVISNTAPYLSSIRFYSIFDTNKYTPECSLTEYVYEHPNNVFVLDADANRDVKYWSENRALPSKEFITRTAYIAGWDTRSPYCLDTFERANMSNPIKGLIANEGAYMILSPDKSPDRILTFLQEHYYPHARCEIVDTITESWTYEHLNVYKFYER